MILHILRSEAEDFSKLTDICIKTKKHWGYPDYLMDLWKDDLTITPRFIRNNIIMKIQNEKSEILGFGMVNQNGNENVYEIKHLWVLPEYSEKSVGRLLLEQLEGRVGHRKTIKVVTDPHTLSFYRKYGYHKVGEAKSKPDGMALPVLKKIIDRQS